MEESKFYERITELYRSLNKSAAVMASDVGISASAMSYYINGKRQPDSKTICKICSKYNCSADWLLGLSDIRSSSEDVKTAVSNLGISERFINNIQGLDKESRLFLFDLLDTHGFTNILLSEYMDYKRIVGELLTKQLIPDEEQNKCQITEDGKVTLSEDEAVNYYAEKVGHTLAFLLKE